MTMEFAAVVAVATMAKFRTFKRRKNMFKDCSWLLLVIMSLYVIAPFFHFFSLKKVFVTNRAVLIYPGFWIQIGASAIALFVALTLYLSPLMIVSIFIYGMFSLLEAMGPHRWFPDHPDYKKIF